MSRNLIWLISSAAIIGLALFLLIPEATICTYSAKRGVAKAQISNLDSAIQSYITNNGGKVPSSLEVLAMPDRNGQTYLREATMVPSDPWGNQFFYRPGPNGITYEVGSYGADKRPSGDGEDGDISNLSLVEERKKGKSSR